MIPLVLAAMLEINLEKVVPGTPDQVFDLWTTREGVRAFFAPAAVIEPHVGGEYTIIFAPDQDPEGLSHGTKGARILEFAPGKKLAFEWIPFTLRQIEGAPGPPVVSEAERNASFTPVEVTFEAAGEGRTLVRLTHRGFKQGEKWQQAHAFFTRAWALVLEELANR